MQFDEFPPLSKEEWKRLIVKSIKAETEADKLSFYTQKLVQKPEPGVEIQPFYTAEDMAELEYLKGFHRLWAQTKKTTGWMNVEWVFAAEEAEANRQAVAALGHGADAVCFNPARPEVDYPLLLKNISLARTPVYFDIPVTQTDRLTHYIRTTERNPENLMGGILNHGGAGNAFYDRQAMAAILKFFAKSPFFKPAIVVGHGQRHTEQLAGTLDVALQLVEDVAEAGLAPETTLPQLGFEMSVGKSYFLEIATLRALRLLWWQIGRMYDENLNLVDVFIQARTANAVPPEKEPYQNLISNTTQAMSAIIGGCDALTVAGGFASESDTILARRVARNVSAILKEESYFDKVTDMGAGSYLIENLTHQLAKAVWENLNN